MATAREHLESIISQCATLKRYVPWELDKYQEVLKDIDDLLIQITVDEHEEYTT